MYSLLYHIQSCNHLLRNDDTQYNLFLWLNSPSNARLLFVHKQRIGPNQVVINVLRKPILSGPLEFDIGTVRDMSEIATKNKVYLFELRCVSCKVQALLAPSVTKHKAKLAISLSGWLGRYTNVEYLQSLPEETRTITVQSLSGL